VRLSIVVPVFNEAAVLERAIRRVLDVELGDQVERELIAVDDCSTDGSRELLGKLADELGIRVLLHETNRGKGAALRTGFAAATGEYILIQDADLEYDPRDIPSLLAPVLAGQADVVYGSRFITGDAHRVLYYWHYVVNRTLTAVCDAITNLNLTDMEVCYKLIRRDLLERITLREDRFGFEPEVTIKLARLEPQPRFWEVGISYAGRTYDEGKKIGFRDGVRALWCLLRYAVAD
jgi:glycosyltransferase involved in cell wall biosynthesis